MISFFQKSGRIQTFTAGIILAVFLLSSVAHIFPPEDAHASVPGHCSVLHVVCNLKEGLFNGGFGLDFLWREIASILIRILTNSIIAWIQGDGGANVGFVGNFEDEFRRQIDGRAGQFLNQLAGVNLCGNIGAALQISLRTHPGVRDYFQCSLTEIVDNVEGFFQDFSKGGWEALIRVALVPKNNPYGAFLVALDKKIDVESAVENSILRNILSNVGFKGMQVAEKRCLDDPVTSVPKGVDETFVQENPDGTFQICYIEHVTKTPGALVADMLTRTVGSGYDFAFVADEINEAIDAIITALINELIGSTLEGIFNPSLAGLPATGNSKNLQITTTSLPNGEVNISYNYQLAAVNGVPPYSWSLSSGSLPPGLIISETGIISGIPQEENIFGFTVKVVDDFGATDLQPLALTIDLGNPSGFTPGVGGCVTVDTLSSGAEAPELNPATTVSLPEGTKDKGYCVHLALSPGVGATEGTWTTTVTKGALPPGLTLYQAEEDVTPPANQHPEISGILTTAGEWNFTVTDIVVITEDGTPVTAGWKQDYSITVSVPPPPPGSCEASSGRNELCSCDANNQCASNSCASPGVCARELICHNIPTLLPGEGVCTLSPNTCSPLLSSTCRTPLCPQDATLHAFDSCVVTTAVEGGSCGLFGEIRQCVINGTIVTEACYIGVTSQPSELTCVEISSLPSLQSANQQQKEIVSTKPLITSLAPSSGAIGTKITLTGTNFTDENKIYFGGYHAATIRRQNGTMSLNVPSAHCSAIPTPAQNCTIPSPNPGDYYVSIVNSKGTSNNLIFTVTK